MFLRYFGCSYWGCFFESTVFFGGAGSGILVRQFWDRFMGHFSGGIHLLPIGWSFTGVVFWGSVGCFCGRFKDFVLSDSFVGGISGGEILGLFLGIRSWGGWWCIIQGHFWRDLSENFAAVAAIYLRGIF